MVSRFTGKKRAVAGLLGLSVLLMALSACNSGGAGASADKGQPGASAGPAQEVKVSMGDFYYTPSDITVKSGKVRFVLTNVGATAHRFSISPPGGSVMASTKNVGAGREGTLEIDLAPGTYKIGCTLGDHEARGSLGKLTVQ